MAFKFTPAEQREFIFAAGRDPRREQVADFFKPGDKVKYRNMAMPAEILSGPHPSFGRDRFLIRKADGNVSLVLRTDLERIVPRIDQVAGTLAMNLYGVPFMSLGSRDQFEVATAARNAIAIADRTKGQPL